MKRSPLVAALVLLALPALARDARCRGGISAAARHFSAKALPGRSEHDRYLAFATACGRDETVALAKKLIAYRTVSADDPAKFGPELEGMAKFLAGWAKANGFTFHAVGQNDVFELGWGEGTDAKLALVFHGDVVPAPPEEWKHPPFAAKVIAGRLYGRGAEDDKGPLASGLVSLAMAKALGLTPTGRVLVVVGNGEEHDWAAMTKYAAQAPKFANTISVDSEFPVMAAQSGFVAWALSAKVEPEAGAKPASGDGQGPRIVDASAGEFLTQVPGTASLTIDPGAKPAAAVAEEVRTAAAALKQTRPGLSMDAPRIQDGKVVVTVHGQSIHASVADQGHNALWDLAALAVKLPGLEPNGISALLSVVANRFDGDHHGEKLKLAYSDALMGPLIVAPTVFRVEEGVATLKVNMRRPKGRDTAQFNALLDAAAKQVAQDTHGVVTEVKDFRHVGDPHLADVSGPLVSTLLDVYRQFKGGDHLVPGSIRGGTYARLFDHGVDFGPGFPGETYSGHASNESISLESLDLTTRMLSEAVYRLALAPEGTSSSAE